MAFVSKAYFSKSRIAYLQSACYAFLSVNESGRQGRARVSQIAESQLC